MALSSDPATKVVYIAKRNPRLSREEFPARWRQHSLLAGSLPSIRPGFAQVAQCLNVYDRDVVPRASLEYDGVNLLTMVTPEHAAAIWQSDEVHNFILSDELETFSTYVRYFSISTLEHVVSEGGMNHFCLIHFLKRDPRMGLAAFGEGLAKAHGAMAGGSRRAVVNLVTDRMPGYNFDAVTELWFSGLDEARDFLAKDGYAGEYLAERGRLCDEYKTLTMWTRINYARPAITEPEG